MTMSPAVIVKASLLRHVLLTSVLIALLLLAMSGGIVIRRVVRDVPLPATEYWLETMALWPVITAIASVLARRAQIVIKPDQIEIAGMRGPTRTYPVSQIRKVEIRGGVWPRLKLQMPEKEVTHSLLMFQPQVREGITQSASEAVLKGGADK